jgi:hypothetical protein
MSSPDTILDECLRPQRKKATGPGGPKEVAKSSFHPKENPTEKFGFRIGLINDDLSLVYTQGPLANHGE